MDNQRADDVVLSMAELHLMLETFRHDNDYLRKAYPTGKVNNLIYDNNRCINILEQRKGK